MKKERPGLLQVILFTLSGLFMAQGIPCWAQVSPNGQTDIFLPAPRELTQHLSRARKAIDEEEYGEAVLHLGQLLTSDALNTPQGARWSMTQDFFIGMNRADNNAGTQISLKAEAQRLLASMPARGQQLYELQFGADARGILDEAIENGDASKLTEVTRKYFHTQAGYEAAILLGRGEMDHGRPLAAAMCFKRVADTGTAAEQFDPELSVLLATCWLRAKLPEAALETLNHLQKRMPDVRINAGDQSLQLFTPGEDLLARLRTISRFSDEIAIHDELQWTMHRGNAGRTGTMAGGMPLQSTWWKVPTANDAGDERLIKQLRQQDRDQGKTSISQLQPLVVDDVVLMRSPDRLLAVNFNNGKRIWEFPWFDQSEQQIVIESPLQRGQGASEKRSSQLRQRLWEDAAFGQLSSDGKTVFVLWEMGYANASSNSRMMMMIGPGGRVQQQGGQSTSNELAALDLETEGSLLWVVGGENGGDEASLAGAFFLGPPLPLHGQLYCLAEFNGEIRLVVLNARDGQFQWSQQLAHVESRTILVDRLRRLSGSSPSFSDGVLICPTSAGAVVAVDISSRSLKWGYTYPLNGGSRQGVIRRPIPTAGMPGQASWLDASVTISADSVLITPVEGEHLICLDLLSGVPRWEPHKRGEGLYIACIHEQSAVLVNKNNVTSISLANGEPAWANPLDLEGEMPSGRGFYSDGHYYLPTTGSRLLQIDAGSGELVESISTEQPLGNLVCYKGQILSQTPGALQSFFQLDLLRKDVDEKLSANPNDPWALARKCELLLQDGDRAAAMETLRRSLAATPEDVGLRALMVKTSLELLRDDFQANRGLTGELEKLIDHPGQRQEYLELLAAGLQDNGQLLAAFDAYMLLIEALSESADTGTETAEQLHLVEKDLRVRRDRWIQVMLTRLHSSSSEEQKKQIDSVILDRYVKAVESGRALPLREYLAYFGQHSSGLNARMQLASRLIESNQAIERELLEAEIHLATIQQSPDTSLHGEALARMALLLHKAERWPEAARVYQQLATAYRDKVVLEGDTGRELMEEAMQDDLLSPYLDRVSWMKGRVNGPTVANNQGQFPSYQRIYQMPLVELQGTLPSSTMVALDQTRNSLVIRDDFGTTLQRVSMSDGRRPVSSSQYSISYARAHGHLMLLSLGPEIVAVDTIRNSQDPSEAILWRKRTTPPTTGDPRFVVNNLRTRSSMTPLGGRRYVAIDNQNRRLGVTGSITANGICFIKMEQLVCVDPLSGDEIWMRDNVTPGSDIYSDDSFVVLVPPDSNAMIKVYSAIDGRLLKSRPRPENETGWHHFGTDTVCYRLDGENLHLLMRDQVNGEIRWQITVPVGTRGEIVEREELVLLQPDGTLQRIDLRSGTIDWTGRCEADPGLTSIHVSKSRTRYRIVTNHSANSSGITIPSMGMQAQLIYGNIYSVDTETGEQLWQSPAAIEGWGLPLYQPAESPVLVMLRQLNPRTAQNRSSSSIKSEFFCIDARDGRLLMAPRQISGYIRSFDVLCSTKKQAVTVVINGQGHLFQLSDDDLPPAAPVQMTASQSANPLGTLGEKVKQALEGNNPFGPRIPRPANRIQLPQRVPAKPGIKPAPKPAPKPVPKPAPPPDK